MALGYVPSGTIAANTMIVFLLHQDGDFALLQSRVHEEWVRLVGSSLEDRLRYITPCFDTFPRPRLEDNAILEAEGDQYYKYRSTIMLQSDAGLTEIYNRFHDPDEHSPDIIKLRSLHAAMDRAVLDAYGWTDLEPTCEFLLDYDDEEDDEDETGGGRRRKKPWRYRWPDDFRDEVLARLLELNRQRAEEEHLSGSASSKRGTGTKKSTKARKADMKKSDHPELFQS
jgi:hypothetical protein